MSKQILKDFKSSINEISKETLQSYMDKAIKKSYEAGAEKITGEIPKTKSRWQGIKKANVKMWKKI